MTLDRFERWLAITSNLAVLVGIIFLALEISQNSDITRAQLYQARAYDGAAFFNQVELPRENRRAFSLSHAAMADSSILS